MFLSWYIFRLMNEVGDGGAYIAQHYDGCVLIDDGGVYLSLGVVVVIDASNVGVVARSRVAVVVRGCRSSMLHVLLPLMFSVVVADHITSRYHLSLATNCRRSLSRFACLRNQHRPLPCVT